MPSRKSLVLTVALPKGLSPSAARKLLQRSLQVKPEEIIKEALRDALRQA